MEETRKRLYFAYGSNMDRGQMQKRCPDSEPVGLAKLEGYRFLINTRGVATVVPDDNGVVHGLLWRISSGDENTLDVYEGVGWGTYRKEVFDVEAEGGPGRRALIYVAADDGKGEPAKEYMDKIIDAAEEHCLPDKYQTELQSWRYDPLHRRSR